MVRLLPVAIIAAFIISVALNFQTIRREVAYKLNISGDPTTSCCNPDVIAKSDGNFDESAARAIFNNQVVDYPKTSLVYQSASTNSDTNSVLGTETVTPTNPNKWIEVSLSEQRLRAWEGNKLAMEFPISSGLWFPTPTGTFNIWYKTRYIRMTGGSKDLGTYYDLANVPDDLFFNQGFALHGAYWHNNFGHPMSHGCVNEPLSNAHQLFEWAGPTLPTGQNSIRASADNPGTRVVVHN